MNLNLQVSVREYLDFILEIEKKLATAYEGKESYELEERKEKLIDNLLQEIENKEAVKSNIERELLHYQSLVNDCEFNHQYVMPFGYTTFKTVHEACSNCTDENEILEDDELYTLEGDNFWMASFKGVDLDSGGVKWYTAVGQKAEDEYLVLKKIDGKDTFESVRP